ncbi:MAG TPA: hypothetical protein VH561_03225 [Micromonosporaceae bacterium]
MERGTIAVPAFAALNYVQEANPSQRTVVARVAYVHPGETHRRVYDVSFVTRDGRHCSSTVNSGFTSAPLTDQPHVGDIVQVRYQAGSQPCALVWEADERVPWYLYAGLAGMFVFGIVGTYVSWRHMRVRRAP